MFSFFCAFLKKGIEMRLHAQPAGEGSRFLTHRSLLSKSRSGLLPLPLPPPPLPADSELAMQLECCQTEVEFVRRRLKQTEEKLEAERQSREQLDTKVRRWWRRRR